MILKSNNSGRYNLSAGFKSIVKTLEVHFPSLGPRKRTPRGCVFCVARMKGSTQNPLVHARRANARRRSPRGPFRGIGDTLHPHQIRTQKRIQLFVPILRSLLHFRGVFALSRHKKHIFDKRSPSSERFCTFGGWAFLFALNLWVIVKIIVCGRYLVLKKESFMI